MLRENNGHFFIHLNYYSTTMMVFFFLLTRDSHKEASKGFISSRRKLNQKRMNEIKEEVLNLNKHDL